MRSSLTGNETQLQIPVLATKLSLPVTSARVLLRPRLAATLQSVLNYRLLLVCAGPGDGKTTLLIKLPDVGYPVVWYSLGRMDRDLPVFLSHVIAGIARHYDGFAQTWWGRIEKSRRLEKELDVILGALVNELVEKTEEHIVFVLDDYHVVEQSRAVNYVVDYLLSYLPADVHLAIASRTEPFIPCLRQPAHGMVIVLRLSPFDNGLGLPSARPDDPFGVELDGRIHHLLDQLIARATVDRVDGIGNQSFV